MMNPEYEAVSSPPSGLIACRVNGVQAHIAQISPRSLLLRTAQPLPANASPEIIFLHPESGKTLSLTIQSFKTGEAQRTGGAVLTRFYFDDAACAAEIRGALNSYARYVEIRSEYGASAYGEEVTGYPLEKDEIFHTSLHQQRDAWFHALRPLKTKLPIALELNCPELWELYLQTPIHAFARAYAAFHELPEVFLSEIRISRLYVGNALCSRLTPDIAVLEAIYEKAMGEGIALTLVTAELRAGGENRADALLAFAAARGLEVVVNDWGMLQRAQSYRGMRLLLGTQLNRSRRDPRMKYKAGIIGREDLPSRGSLNSPVWLDHLRSCGVTRFEYESSGMRLSPPEAACSLHLPFFQTNTALWCPLQAICEHGDRGAQLPPDDCPRWCSRNVLLYPAHLNMIGRWNSIQALDQDAFSTDSFTGFDRLVLNF